MSLSFFARKLAICSGVLIAGLAVATAQNTVVGNGSEFSILGNLPGDQTFPHAAVDANGGYVVWQDNSVSILGLRIRAQRLNGGFGTVGAPVVVSSAAISKTAGDQENPQVALLPDGGAVVVWQGGKRGLQQIYARYFDANGTPEKSDIRVGSHTKNNQFNPAIAALPDGTIMVVWTSSGDQDGSRQGVFAQLLSSDGAKIGQEFQINQWTLNNQRSPSVAALANGNFVVTWVSELQRSAASVDIYARLFNASGAPLGNEFPVNAVVNKICANPTVAGSPVGGFAVAWSQNDNISIPTPTISKDQTVQIPGSAVSPPSQNSWDIFARVFDNAGNASADPFRLNNYTFGWQVGPKMSSLGSDYLAVWTSEDQTNSIGHVDPREGVFGQVISEGAPVLSEDLHVNTTTASQQVQPIVTADGENRFLVIWSSFVGGGFSFDLLGQIYLHSTP